MNWEKIFDKLGSAMISACLIIFGGVVVKGLFGDGSDKVMLILAISSASLLFFIGIIFCGIKFRKVA